MRLALLIVSMFALLTTPVAGYKAQPSAGSPQQSGSGKTQASAGIAAIESYCKEIDRYSKSNPKAMRYFVNGLPGEGVSQAGGEQKWYEVKSADELSDAERGYATRSIAALMKSGVLVYASLGAPMEHSRHENDYYFRGDGTLAKISSDYWSNMGEVHLVRESFYDSSGKLLRESAQCFQIIYGSKGSRDKRVSCGRSDMRGEIEEYKIPVYKRNSDLPGYALLKKS